MAISCLILTYQMLELQVGNKQGIKQDPAEIFLIQTGWFRKGNPMKLVWWYTVLHRGFVGLPWVG